MYVENKNGGLDGDGRIGWVVGKAVHFILRSGERIPVARNAVVDGRQLASLAERIREGALAHRRDPDATIAALSRGTRDIPDIRTPRLRVALETIGSGTDHDELLAEMLEDVEIEAARTPR